MTKVFQLAQCQLKLKRLLMDHRKPKNVAVVVMVDKNVRVAWALLFYDETFKHDNASGPAVRRMVLHFKAELTHASRVW